MEFPEVDPEAWKHIPGSRRRQLYADAVATSGGADPTSAAWGKALVRVLATLPRGMLDLRGLRKIMHQQRRRHKDTSVEVHNPSLTPQTGTQAAAAGESPQKPGAAGEPQVALSAGAASDAEPTQAASSLRALTAPSASAPSATEAGADSPSPPAQRPGGIAAMAIAMATAASRVPGGESQDAEAAAGVPSAVSARGSQVGAAADPATQGQAAPGSFGASAGVQSAALPGDARGLVGESSEPQRGASLASTPPQLANPAAMRRAEFGQGASPATLGFAGPAADAVSAHSSPADYYARHLPPLPRHYVREAVMENAPSDAAIVKVRHSPAAADRPVETGLGSRARRRAQPWPRPRLGPRLDLSGHLGRGPRAFFASPSSSSVASSRLFIPFRRLASPTPRPSAAHRPPLPLPSSLFPQDTEARGIPPETTLRLLANSQGNFWIAILVRTMAFGEPSAATVPDAAEKACRLGFLDPRRIEPPYRERTLSAIRRAAKTPSFVAYPSGKYQLVCFARRN